MVLTEGEGRGPCPVPVPSSECGCYPGAWSFILEEVSQEREVAGQGCAGEGWIDIVMTTCKLGVSEHQVELQVKPRGKSWSVLIIEKKRLVLIHHV